MTKKEIEQKRILNQIATLEYARQSIIGSYVFHKPFLSLKVKIKTLFTTFRFSMDGIVVTTFRSALDQAIEGLRNELKKLER